VTTEDLNPLGSYVRALHPGLSDENHRVSSPRDPGYNCIAHAIGSTETWWAPGGYPGSAWPPEIEQADTLEAWRQFFALHGFERSGTARDGDGFELVAIYALGGEGTHVALQLPDGRWTSKLGALQDIEHTLDALEDARYGDVALFMRRPRREQGS
jgi:hypothetical protein